MEPNELLSKQNFIDLSTKVNALIKAQTWTELHGTEIFHLLLRFLGFGAGFALFTQTGLILKILGILVMGYFYVSIAVTGTHQTRHDSLIKSKTANQILAYILGDFWTNQSNHWWFHRHVVEHHTFTNMPDRDPPNFFYPWLNKYLYFFLAPLVVPFWLLVNSLVFHINKKQYARIIPYLLISTAGWIAQIYALSLFTPNLGWAILSAYAVRVIFAPMFMHIAVFNHIGLESPETKLPWLPHQTKTTRNLKTHWFIATFGGYALVDCHIEHHLFPNLPDNTLPKIQPLLRQYLKKEGYNYHEDSYLFLLKNCLKYYEQVFKYNERPWDAV